MIVELLRALIQRIISDKLLLGLVIIMIIAPFAIGTGPKKDSENESQGSPSADKRQAQEVAAPQGNSPSSHEIAQQQANPQAQTTEQNNAPSSAKVASEFIHWWLTKAMDYQMNTLEASQKLAMGYIKPAPAKAFANLFWNDALKANIQSGTAACSFQPTSVKSVAINPDGSIVVEASGTLVLQQTGTPPTTQYLVLDFQVKQETKDWRIVGFFHKATLPAS
jgi:hypothetical protein